MDMVVAKASAQWFCYLSIQHNVRLVPVERLAPIDLPQLASTDGSYFYEFHGRDGELPRTEFSQTVAKAREAGVRCSQIVLDFQGLEMSRHNLWLQEYVFWATSLATKETLLKLLPKDSFPELLEVIDPFIGVPWAVSSNEAVTAAWRFHGAYLRAVQSLDHRTLWFITMQGQNRLSLRFESSHKPRLDDQGSWLSIMADLADKDWNSKVFHEFSSSRREMFVLVRSALGAKVAAALCELWECECTTIQLASLPTDYQLTKRRLMNRYQKKMKTSRAVMILPFDLYDVDKQLAYRGTILDHPHWYAFALMVAHHIARNSLEPMVIPIMLSAKYSDVFDDMVVISCPDISLEVAHQQRPQSCWSVLVHGIEYASQRVMYSGVASKSYYFGYFWEPGAISLALEAPDFDSKDFWGCLACLPGESFQVHPMAVILNAHMGEHIDCTNYWNYLLKEKMPPSLLGVNLLVSMQSSGQTYVRTMLELMSSRPTKAVGMFSTIRGNSFAQCFPHMSSVNVSAEPIVWIAHSILEAGKLIPFAFMKSLVVIVRNYAQVWYKFKFRWQRGLKRRGKNLPSTTPDEVLEEFAGEYLEPLKAVLKLPPAKKLVVYFEEILEAEGTLPESLLQLWEVPAQELVNVSRAERIEQLRKIGQGCDEFDADCDAVNCRNLKVNYGRSEAMIPSAPREMTMEELPDIVRMEEMFCQKAPEVVNTFLLHDSWGSGFLKNCTADGLALLGKKGSQWEAERRGQLWQAPCSVVYGGSAL